MIERRVIVFDNSSDDNLRRLIRTGIRDADWDPWTFIDAFEAARHFDKEVKALVTVLSRQDIEHGRFLAIPLMSQAHLLEVPHAFISPRSDDRAGIREHSADRLISPEEGNKLPKILSQWLIGLAQQ